MTTKERAWRDALPRSLSLVGIAAAAILVLVAAVAWSELSDISLRSIFQDPSQTAGIGPLTGAMSHVGVLLWWAAAVIALFAAYLLRGLPARQDARRFLVGAGFIGCYLAIDDLFLLHEAVLNKNMPLPQPGILAIMALVIAVYFIAFRTFVRTTAWPLLLIAGAMFAGSLAIDLVENLGVFLDAWKPPSYIVFVEESFKWLGIVAWATYLIGVSATASRPSTIDLTSP